MGNQPDSLMDYFLVNILSEWSVDAYMSLHARAKPKGPKHFIIISNSIDHNIIRIYCFPRKIGT